MTYAEKLRDPRWQKKRLEIFQRDEFMCRDCGSSKKELHVHHPMYAKDTEPWDYPDDLYVTLCYECHKERPIEEMNLMCQLTRFTSAELVELHDAFELAKIWGMSAIQICKVIEEADLNEHSESSTEATV